MTGPVAAHPGVARAWLVVGSVAAVVLLAVGPFAVASVWAHEEEPVSRTYAAELVRIVVLQVDEGSVAVVGDATDVVRVEGRAGRGLRGRPVAVSVTGGGLVVRSECSGPFTLHCGVDLTVHVPPGTPVAGATVDADVTVRGTTAGVDLSVRDGDVTLESVSGAVRADVRDGTVRGTALGEGPVRSSARDGDIDLGFAVAPLSVDATSRDGSVDVIVPAGSGPYQVTATSGDGTVDTPVRTDPAASRSVRLATRNGDVALRYPAT